MALVGIHKVSKVFQESLNSIAALDDISIDIESGSFNALCGPSGSGKTTLLNLIGCLDRPTSGQIVLGDIAVSSLPQAKLTEVRRDKIGFIFQDYNLIPKFTVAENIEYILWLQGVGRRERRKRAAEICLRFGIRDLIKRYPAQLSRGQQQRIAVARAIVHKPAIVLGDELTANLDHKTGAALMDFLRELNEEEQITFIYATHDPMMMERADRIISLVDGRLQRQDNCLRRRTFLSARPTRPGNGYYLLPGDSHAQPV